MSDQPVRPADPSTGEREHELSAGTQEQPLERAKTGAPDVRVPRTRTSAAFKSFIAGTVVLALLLVFILENTARTRITYFGASGHMPLGVALLLAAIAGALLSGILGTVRILQLRRRIKRGSTSRVNPDPPPRP